MTYTVGNRIEVYGLARPSENRQGLLIYVTNHKLDFGN